MLRFNIWFALTDYYKMRQIWLQNVLAILLQNARRPYYKMRQVFYYKTQQFYYKIGLLLQIATTLLQNATVITKCHAYYKLRQYNTLLAKNVYHSNSDFVTVFIAVPATIAVDVTVFVLITFFQLIYLNYYIKTIKVCCNQQLVCISKIEKKLWKK